MEAALEFPLLLSFPARFKKLLAGGRSLFAAQRIVCARGDWPAESILLPPQAGTRKKVVLQARANHLLEIGVVKAVRLHGAHIFVREFAARNSFIIRR